MPYKTIQTDRLMTYVYDTRREMGKAAAEAAAAAIRQVLLEKETANVISLVGVSGLPIIGRNLSYRVAFQGDQCVYTVPGVSSFPL